jgi:hypothetical protein
MKRLRSTSAGRWWLSKTFQNVNVRVMSNIRPALPIYGEMIGLKVISVLTMGVFIQSRPTRFFKIVRGLPAGAEDPQIQLLDNREHILAIRHGNRLQDGSRVDSRA